MTLREFIKETSYIKEELLDKEIVIRAENGLLFEPKIKFIAKQIGNLRLDTENVDKVIVTWE
jgi:hypothetical protein